MEGGVNIALTLHAIGNSVDDVQVTMKGNPNKNGSTDPSHSQLAKDHDDHPFHTLAAALAKHAVKEVGIEMAGRWWGGRAISDPAALAGTYLVHPMDTHWQDAIVKDWARRHPKELIEGESATFLEELEQAHKKETLDRIAATRDNLTATWDYVSRYYNDIFDEPNKVTPVSRKDKPARPNNGSAQANRSNTSSSIKRDCSASMQWAG